MLKDNWHRFWIHFYSILLDDCLDASEGARLINKMERHQAKLGAKAA